MTNSTKPLPKTLYHYTSASALPTIISKGGGTSLYATHSDYLNDSNELNTGTKLIKDIIEHSPEILCISDEQLGYLQVFFDSKLFSKNTEAYFLTCFSETTGVVDQWRGYGDSGHGFALGYDYNLLAEFADSYKNVHFLECVYDRDDQISLIVESAKLATHEYGSFSKSSNVNESIGRAIDNYSFAMTIAESTLRIKNQAFKQEKEWRLVVSHSFNDSHLAQNMEYISDLNFRTTRRGLVPYIELKLPSTSRIVVGPSPDQIGNERALDILLKTRLSKKDHGIETRLEDIPYRE